jgi:hypothetical protein
VAGMGPIPIRWGSTPATAEPRIRARGVSPSPSPLSRNHQEGGGPVVDPRGISGRDRSPGPEDGPQAGQVLQGGAGAKVLVLGHHQRVSPPLGDLHRDDLVPESPPSTAAAARRWLSTAKASWASRVTPYSWATTSAVSPSPMVHSAEKAGLGKRHPRTVSAISGVPRA